MAEPRPEVAVSATDTGYDTQDLRAFCRVVDLGSITAAAATLGETKGSVSRRVARLERGLGVPLLVRTGRNVRPTEEGAVFRDRAAHALSVLDDAAASLRRLDTAPVGHLRVTAPPGIGTLVLGPVIAPFMEAYPGITLEILLTDEVLSFRDHGIDVALRAAASLPDSSLVAHKLLPIDAMLIAAPAYLERHGAPAEVADLARHRLLSPQPRSPMPPLVLVEEAPPGRRVEVTVRPRVVSPDVLILREAVLAGAGIGFSPLPMARADIDAGRLVRVLPAWRVTTRNALWLLHAGGPLPPKVRAFRDFVRDHLRAPPAVCTIGAR